MNKVAQKIGVAIYAKNDPFSNENNWACEYRSEPFSFVSASDLPAQTLWITNVELSSLIGASLHKNPKIAHSGYFRTRIPQMQQELGILDWPADQQAALLAEMIGSAAEMSKLQLGLTQYPSNGLAPAVGQLHGLPEAPHGSIIHRIAEQSCQNYTRCERARHLKDAKMFSFWLPRYEWANRLLSEPLPVSENIKSIALHELPSMGRDASEVSSWARENKVPLFARIRIHGLEEVVGKLMNYGSGAQSVTSSTDDGDQYDARNMREWCSLPELEVLSQAGDVELLDVVMAGGWARSGLHVIRSKPCSVSYSYGLLAENLWVGLTRKPTSDSKVSNNLTTAWLQAVDRMHCLRVAERLYGLGMEVTNYGYGRITVACPLSVVQLIPQVARENGLMYPASLKDLPGYQPNRDRAYTVLQSLMASGDFTNLRKMNQFALSEMQEARRRV